MREWRLAMCTGRSNYVSEYVVLMFIINFENVIGQVEAIKGL